MISFRCLARNRNHVFKCISIFLFASLSVFPFFRLNVNRSDGNIWQVGLVWFALSLAYGLVTFGLVTLAVGKNDRSWLRFLIPASLPFIAAGRALELPGFRNFGSYGDTLSFFVTDNEDMGRWLLSYAAVRELFNAVNALLLDIAPLAFVRMSGSLLMLAWGCWIVSRRESLVTPWLIVLSPIWVLLSVGHDEIYPFVAGLTMAVSWQVLSGQQIFDRNTSYILAGVLPALYVGTSPVSLALIVFTWGHQDDNYRRIKGLIVAVVSFAVAVEIGGDFKGYFNNLERDLNIDGLIRSSEGFLEDNAIAVTSSGSFLASAAYAFSLLHLLDIVFWLVCGTGLLVLIWALVDSWASDAKRRSLDSTGSVNTSLLIGLARFVLVASAVVFFVLMLPQLGPTADIDLYFWAMFVVLLLVGTHLDRRLGEHECLQLESIQLPQLIALGFAPVTAALVVFGVARY